MIQLTIHALFFISLFAGLGAVTDLSSDTKRLANTLRQQSPHIVALSKSSSHAFVDTLLANTQLQNYRSLLPVTLSRIFYGKTFNPHEAPTARLMLAYEEHKRSAENNPQEQALFKTTISLYRNLFMQLINQLNDIPQETKTELFNMYDTFYYHPEYKHAFRPIMTNIISHLLALRNSNLDTEKKNKHLERIISAGITRLLTTLQTTRNRAPTITVTSDHITDFMSKLRTAIHVWPQRIISYKKMALVLAALVTTGGLAWYNKEHLVNFWRNWIKAPVQDIRTILYALQHNNILTANDLETPLPENVKGTIARWGNPVAGVYQKQFEKSRFTTRKEYVDKKLAALDALKKDSKQYHTKPSALSQYTGLIGAIAVAERALKDSLPKKPSSDPLPNIGNAHAALRSVKEHKQALASNTERGMLARIHNFFSFNRTGDDVYDDVPDVRQHMSLIEKLRHAIGCHDGDSIGGGASGDGVDDDVDDDELNGAVAVSGTGRRHDVSHNAAERDGGGVSEGKHSNITATATTPVKRPRRSSVRKRTKSSKSKIRREENTPSSLVRNPFAQHILDRSKHTIKHPRSNSGCHDKYGAAASANDGNVDDDKLNGTEAEIKPKQSVKRSRHNWSSIQHLYDDLHGAADVSDADRFQEEDEVEEDSAGNKSGSRTNKNHNISAATTTPIEVPKQPEMRRHWRPLGNGLRGLGNCTSTPTNTATNIAAASDGTCDRDSSDGDGVNIRRHNRSSAERYTELKKEMDLLDRKLATKIPQVQKFIKKRQRELNSMWWWSDKNREEVDYLAKILTKIEQSGLLQD